VYIKCGIYVHIQLSSVSLFGGFAILSSKSIYVQQARVGCAYLVLHTYLLFFYLVLHVYFHFYLQITASRPVIAKYAATNGRPTIGLVVGQTRHLSKDSNR
jgi:hypothetical protein